MKMKKILILALFTYSISAHFICKDYYLYTNGVQGYLTGFESNEDCLKAVKNSQSGFICKNHYLYSVGQKNIALALVLILNALML